MDQNPKVLLESQIFNGSVQVSANDDHAIAHKAETNTGHSKSKWTTWLVFSVFSVVIGSSVQCGVTLSSINRNKDDIDHFYNISRETFLINSLGQTTHWGLVVAVYSLGGIFGAFLGRRLADVCGRRNSLILNNIFVLVGGIVQIVAVSPTVLAPDVLIVARFFTGANFGLTIVIAPMYLAEISPANRRGVIIIAHQLGLNSGILLTLALGLPEIFGEFQSWPYLFGTHLAIIPLQMLSLPFCPKSPRYLVISKGDITGAVNALRKLRGAGHDIEEEISQMREEKAETHMKMAMLELLTSRLLRKPLALSVFIQLVQQTNGMIVIFAYSNIIFEGVGLPKRMSGHGTVGLACSYILGALVCSFLIDRTGRRSLFLTGLPLQTTSYVILTIAFVTGSPEVNGDWSGYVSIVVMNLVLFFCCIYVGLAWSTSAELFTQGPRATAMSFCSMCNRFFNFSLIFLFPMLRVALEKYTFVFFAVLCSFYAIIIYFFLPETRNKTFLDIQREIYGVDISNSTEEKIITYRETSL